MLYATGRLLLWGESVQTGGDGDRGFRYLSGIGILFPSYPFWWFILGAEFGSSRILFAKALS